MTNDEWMDHVTEEDMTRPKPTSKFDAKIHWEYDPKTDDCYAAGIEITEFTWRPGRNVIGEPAWIQDDFVPWGIITFEAALNLGMEISRCTAYAMRPEIRTTPSE